MSTFIKVIYGGETTLLPWKPNNFLKSFFYQMVGVPKKRYILNTPPCRHSLLLYP